MAVSNKGNAFAPTTSVARGSVCVSAIFTWVFFMFNILGHPYPLTHSAQAMLVIDY